jgi:hypothetical protein
MYGFNASNDKKSVSEKLDFKWNLSCPRPGLGEDDYLFVFINKKEVVSYVYFSRRFNDSYLFCGLDLLNYLRPENSILEIKAYKYNGEFSSFRIKSILQKDNL